MDVSPLLRGLTEAQSAAVTSDGAPLCILAGAGSGKTRVLTRRIAYRIATGSADARHVMVLTFTRKAAGELGRRLRSLGVEERVTAGTFHALAFAALRRHWSDVGAREPALLERKVGLVTKLLGARLREEGVEAVDVAGEIEWAKTRLVAPSGYEEAARTTGRRPPFGPSAMASVFERYEVEKRRRGLVDFDDLLLDAGRLVGHDAGARAAERWRVRHLFVDEFQDVNPAQWQLLEAWRGGRADLCVVGDPDQAIYAWNGADARYLTGFTDHFPGASVVPLHDNFRSSPQVLAVADAVLGGPHPLVAHQGDGPVPTVRAYATDRDEATGIARAVRAGRRPGGWWSETAVLARTHAQTAILEEALAAAGVPCRVRNGHRFLRRPEVQLSLDRLAAKPTSFQAWLTDLEVESRAVPDDGPAAEERRAVLAELVRFARDFVAGDQPTTAEGFLGWLSLHLRTEGPSDRADAVDVVTFHAAKGLEWPTVFLAGLEDGLVPLGPGRGDGAVAEERRLLYVALTRAERALHLSWSRTRTFGTKTVTRSPSPWLADVEAARTALAGGGGPDLRLRMAEVRRRLRVEDGGADPQVLDALRAWRSAAARAAGVPAHLVLHDATLEALAEARPRTRAGLLELPGLGPVRTERFGDALLDVLAGVAS